MKYRQTKQKVPSGVNLESRGAQHKLLFQSQYLSFLAVITRVEHSIYFFNLHLFCDGSEMVTSVEARKIEKNGFCRRIPQS